VGAPRRCQGPSGPLSGNPGPSGPLSGNPGPSGPLSGNPGPSGPLSGRPVVRDRSEPVFGWRYWHLSANGLLRSVTQRGIEWRPGQVLRAVCLEIGHPAPAERCNCGIYANPDLEALRQHGLCLAPEAVVVGQVGLWGRVVVDEPSYRGELAYPARLSLVIGSVPGPTTVAAALDGLAAYGVPVSTMAIADAVGGMSADMLRFQAMSRGTGTTGP